MLNITVLIPVLVLSKTPKISENTTLFVPTVFKWRGEGNSPKKRTLHHNRDHYHALAACCLRIYSKYISDECFNKWTSPKSFTIC